MKLFNFLGYVITAPRQVAGAVIAVVVLGATSLVHAQSSATALDDDAMHWDTRLLSLEDAYAAIDANVLLRPYRDLIIDRCGLHSINPRLAVLLMTSGDALTLLDPGSGEAMRTRIDAFLNAVPRVYYLGRRQAALPDAVIASAAMSDNTAGMRALARTFVTSAADDSRFDLLSQCYAQAYGLPERVKSAVAPAAPAAAPTNFLRLPWTLGQMGWSFNAVHTTGGGCATPTCGAPRSSIDFSLGWPVWGSDTSPAQVLAANDGVVTKFSGCNLRVTHSNGWATNYYHLSGALVRTGDTVVVGQPLAIYANNTAEALCQGGSSTGPHVHFSLLNAGAHVDIDQSELSGWRVNATNVIQDYDSNCSRMYLSRNGVSPCAYAGGSPPGVGNAHAPVHHAIKRPLCAGHRWQRQRQCRNGWRAASALPARVSRDSADGQCGRGERPARNRPGDRAVHRVPTL
jgi:LasA protease